MTEKRKVVLSKSKLMGGLQCSKQLYLSIHYPKLARPVSLFEQALFDQGHLVGAEARKRFPGGFFVKSPAWEFEGAAKITSEAIHRGEKILFEAAFLNGPLFARVDVLKKSEKGWEMIEVKSSTSLKTEHLDDCSIQYVILRGLGLDICNVKLMYINKDCTAPDLSHLFITEDVTEEVIHRSREMKEKIKTFLEAAKLDKIPQVRIGPHCQSPYDCRFKQHCFSEALVPPISALTLPKLTVEKKWELYHSNKDIYTDDLGELPELTQRAIEVLRKGTPFLNREGVFKELSSWKRPFWFLDFETISFAIPKFDGTKPYEHIPFQYSLHVQGEQRGVRHEEFLDTSGNDPREPLIKKLLSDIGPNGDIIAYHAKFECDVIRRLASAFPQYSDALLKLIPRFKDPLPLIRENIYFSEFNGSFSLKAVAPALMGRAGSYEDLNIKDGVMAQAAYLSILSGKLSEPQVDEAIQNLRDYCRQDTQVLVELANYLENVSKTVSPIGIY